MGKLERLQELLAKVRAGTLADRDRDGVIVDTDGTEVRLGDPRAAEALERRIVALEGA